MCVCVLQVIPLLDYGGDSEDYAKRALIKAVGLQDQRINLFIVFHTDLCSLLAQRLRHTFDVLPKSVDTIASDEGGALHG